MKKSFLLAVSALLTIGASAQEAFKSVGVGVEVGLIGPGIQVSMPVVSDHLFLVMGYNFANLSVNKTIEDIGYGELNNNIAILNKQVTKLNEYNQLHDPSHIQYNTITPLAEEVSVDAKAKLNMSSFKVLAEYYPSAKGSFHLTAGFMIGNENMLEVGGAADPVSNQTYRTAMKLNNDLRREDPNLAHELLFTKWGVDDLNEALRLNVAGKTYHLNENVEIDAALKINKVRPYFGIGFGRPIPKGRVGFQFELGAWCHGTPKIGSPNEMKYVDDASQNETIDDVIDIVEKVTFWPQMTFRLTGRIF